MLLAPEYASDRISGYPCFATGFEDERDLRKFGLYFMEKIYIESPHKLQRKLLAHFLTEETGYSCLAKSTKIHLNSRHVNRTATTLLLWDCSGKSFTIDNLLSTMTNSKHISRKYKYIALFNQPSADKIESQLIRKGIRGVFYEDDSLEIIAKGIKLILKGELWFSRASLSKIITEIIPSSSLKSSNIQDLTAREKEILLHLSTGLSNIEIAEKLFISRYTVKTHIQNIYKKINVSKRSQATNWALMNCHQLPPKD